VTTVGYLKGKVRRKIEQRIDWADWTAVFLALLHAEPDGDGAAGGALAGTREWASVLHRLLHPWNTQAVRLTGFELVLVLMVKRIGTPDYDRIAASDRKLPANHPPVLAANYFAVALREDNEDALALAAGGTSAASSPGGNGGDDGAPGVSTRRPEVLEMEYPESSSAQGLAVAKVDFTSLRPHTVHGAADDDPAGGSGGLSGFGDPLYASYGEEGEERSPMSFGGDGRGFFSVKLLRAASCAAALGIRAL